MCSVAGGILTVSLIFSIVFLAAFLITSVAYYDDECELRTAKKWRKYTGIIGIISVVFAILVPSRSICYQIFGVTVATEVIKNSEALQELPEKSFEAINRLLDSIASEDKEEGTHTKTMKFLKDDKHCPYLFDRRYGLYS